MEDILSACSWASPSTFTDFYHRDIALLTKASTTWDPLLLLNVLLCCMILNKVLFLVVLLVSSLPILIVQVRPDLR